jgi:hypothetical protein
MPPGIEQEELLLKALEAEAAVHMHEQLSPSD